MDVWYGWSMKRWHALVVTMVALLAAPAGVRGQPGPSPRPTPPAQAAQQPRPGPGPQEQAEAQSALQRAERARTQARCLRSASIQVDAAARRLRWARGDKMLTERRVALNTALGKLDACWDAAFDDSAVVRTVRPGPAPPSRRYAHFGFGQIRVEQGRIDRLAVARPLRTHAARYRHCYDQALHRAPDLEGTVQFRLHLAREHNHTVPTSVAIPDATLGDAAVRRCLAQALLTTAFPPQADGSTVSLTMAFATVSQ